jgi:hypothetical protein
LKYKGDSLETESVRLVSPPNVTKKIWWLPLKQINIRLTQGKSNISDDTAVKEAVGKFSVNGEWW